MKLLFSTVTVNTKLPLPTEAAVIVIVSFTKNPTPLCTTTEPSVALPFVCYYVKTAEATPLPDVAFDEQMNMFR